jgi:hypothetical protein
VLRLGVVLFGIRVSRVVGERGSVMRGSCESGGDEGWRDEGAER